MPGKVVASYLVKVVLHKRDDLPDPPTSPGQFNSESEPPIPTIAELTELIGGTIYDKVDYFTEREISVSAERTDR